MPRYSKSTIAKLKQIARTTEQSRFKRGMENPRVPPPKPLKKGAPTGPVPPPKPLKREK